MFCCVCVLKTNHWVSSLCWKHSVSAAFIQRVYIGFEIIYPTLAQPYKASVLFEVIGSQTLRCIKHWSFWNLILFFNYVKLQITGFYIWSMSRFSSFDIDSGHLYLYKMILMQAVHRLTFGNYYFRFFCMKENKWITGTHNLLTYFK